MGYPIEQRPASKNGWFTPAESNAYYAARYARTGVTVHWWGDGTGANNHDNIVNYILGQAQAGNKSANYVVSDVKITELVSPDNVAWCSGPGNPTTISIEFQPTLSDEGYKRGGWLIAELERRYGRKLNLFKHSQWQSTACPGTIDLNRLRAEADKQAGGTAPVPVQTSGGNEVITTADQAIKMYKMLRPNGNPSQGEIDSTAGRRTFAGFLNDAQAEIAARDAGLRNQSAQIASLTQTVQTLTAQAEELSKRPTLENFNAMQGTIQQCQVNAAELKKQNDALQAEKAADQASGDTFLRHLGQLIKKYIPGL